MDVGQEFWDVLQKTLSISQGINVGDIDPYIQTGIHSIVIALKPTASMVLSFFAMIELYRIFTKMDNAGMSQIMSLTYTVIWALVKMSIAIFIIRHLDAIMWAIYAVSNTAMSAVKSVSLGGGTVAGIDKATIDSMVQAAGTGLMDKIMLRISLAPVNFLLWLSGIIVNVMVLGRMVEIYVQVALSPFPLSTFVCEEYSQVGKSFIKSFLAVCFQGAAMIIVIKIYDVLMMNGLLTGNSLMEVGMNALQYSLVLVFCLFMSSKFAKSIAGAM